MSLTDSETFSPGSIESGPGKRTALTVCRCLEWILDWILSLDLKVISASASLTEKPIFSNRFRELCSTHITKTPEVHL